MNTTWAREDVKEDRMGLGRGVVQDNSARTAEASTLHSHPWHAPTHPRGYPLATPPRPTSSHTPCAWTWTQLGLATVVEASWSDPLQCLRCVGSTVSGGRGRGGGVAVRLCGLKLALLVCGFYYIMLVSNGLSAVTSLTAASSASCQLTLNISLPHPPPPSPSPIPSFYAAAILLLDVSYYTLPTS